VVGPIYQAQTRHARLSGYLMSVRGSVDQDKEWIAGFMDAI
jgi:hypothetical protein